MRWLVKAANDPAWRAAMTGQVFKQNAFRAASLSPDDRLQVLRLLKDMTSESTQDCRLPWASGADFFTIAKTASPHALEDMMEVMDIVVKSANPPHPQEHYAVTDLLNAEAQTNATPAVAPGTHGYPPGQCGALAFAVDAVTALPEPTRQRASFEFFRLLAGEKAAFQTVLDDPSAYLDDEFDERQLPDALRRRLPADGSHPLPFSRLTIDADWVNKTTPGDNAAFKDIFINRRNNGVIAEVVNANHWSDFTLSYGIATLRTQTVGSGGALSELGTLEDDTAIVAANHEPLSGQSFDIAAPQPSTHGQASRHCDVGQSAPASTIFSSLTGTAVSLQCSEVEKGGKAVHWHAAWLADYGIAWTDSIDDEDGRTEAVIRNVTIEGASQ